MAKYRLISGPKEVSQHAAEMSRGARLRPARALHFQKDSPARGFVIRAGLLLDGTVERMGVSTVRPNDKCEANVTPL
jgi:hypothetical protein